ncbi:DUF924 family protein [Noviherbaspirillum sedimenti]|uniref:DUF924 domain-containing protein n=1 Tax=Noviherbaspirillum sedimenti TaxID=2320865 RepID=A0A3A3GCG2_9BURK|nr:DUF924 family protein [Noviherbaspirillum sedimenti]RJG04352.1 DUF924 domain-containing protein [Noviherbaspirillum sedimenti]
MQNTLHEFWFGFSQSDAELANEKAKLWWRKNPQADAEIRQRFEAWVTKAANRELDAWSRSAAGCLALILLLDQFPRNIYRDTPQAFALDPLALAYCKEGMRNGFDMLLRPIERVFFYLPLEHSESREDQDLAVALFEKLLASVPLPQRPVFAGFLDFAVRHRDIVARFGRFPHRNRILGRPSRPEELEFLQEKGSSF